MAWKNLYEKDNCEQAVGRINQLSPETQGEWGVMAVDQMMAHCNVAYDMALTDKYPRPNAFIRFMAKLFAKNQVVGPKPYPKNGRTAPEFVISDRRNFEEEKKRLVDNIWAVQKLGPTHFDGKQSLSFGALTKDEWNILFSKHLDHHLRQFGV